MNEPQRPAPLEIVTRPIYFAPLLLLLSAGLAFATADRTMPISDEGALLTAAAKILRGGVFYRDIDAYAFPGVSYLLAAAMSIFGEHLSVARALAGAIYCVMVMGVYASALALMDQKRAALCGLCLLSLKFFAYPIYTMFFYADASVAAAVVALALFLRHRFDGASQRLFWVGVLAGLSIVTKQSSGIYVAGIFALVLCFPGFAPAPSHRGARLAETLVYAAGLVVVVGSISAYFAFQGVFLEMIHGALVRPFTGYLPTGGVSFLPPLEWWRFGALHSEGTVYFSQLYWETVLLERLPGRGMQAFYFGVGELASRVLYSAIPIVFGACAWLWIRAHQEIRRAKRSVAKEIEGTGGSEGPQLARGRFFSAAGVSLAIAVSAFPRTDFVHVMTIYPAIVLILFALARPTLLGHGWTDRVRTTPRAQGRRLRLETIFVALLSMTTIYLGLRYDSVLTHRLELDRAAVWVKPGHAWLGSLVEYIEKHVPEDESLFVYGHEAQWYFLSGRFTPRSFSQIYPGMTGDETGAKLATHIRETRPPVIAQGVLQWPGMPAVVPYTQEAARTIQQLYRLDPGAIEGAPNPRMLRVWRIRE